MGTRETTILLVDDMEIVREPVADTLRAHGYNVLTAGNGREAVKIARSKKIDLAILDISMPVMNGFECLHALRGDPHNAKMPVMVLSSVSQREMVRKMAACGINGYMLKSDFTTKHLLEQVQALTGRSPATLEPAAAAQAPHREAPVARDPKHHTRDEVLARLRHEVEIQSIKPVLEHVIALTRSSMTTLEEIASAMRQDQALSLRVLKVANSSFYLSGKPVTSLQEASQRIGLQAVRNAVIAILSVDHFQQTVPGLDMNRFWQHSLATAVLAETIGKKVEFNGAETLFLAGLLHDVGRMVFCNAYPEDYAAVLGKSGQRPGALREQEIETFEISHDEVTGELLAKWNITPVVVEAAAMHETGVEKLTTLEHATAALAVALANRLAHALIEGSSGDASLHDFRALAAALKLDVTAIGSVCETALQKTQDTEMFYASHSRDFLPQTLLDDLRKAPGGRLAVALLDPKTAGDPLPLFFERLGCLETRNPDVLVAGVHSTPDYTKRLAAADKADPGGKLPVLFIGHDSESKEPGPPGNLQSSRPHAFIALPCTYTALLTACVALAPAPQTVSMASK